MRDSARIDPLLLRLGAAWKMYPDLRLGQLISNACVLHVRDQFSIEDEPLIELIERALRSEFSQEVEDE